MLLTEPSSTMTRQWQTLLLILFCASISTFFVDSLCPAGRQPLRPMTGKRTLSLLIVEPRLPGTSTRHRGRGILRWAEFRATGNDESVLNFDGSLEQVTEQQRLILLKELDVKGKEVDLQTKEVYLKTLEVELKAKEMLRKTKEVELKMGQVDTKARNAYLAHIVQW